MVESKYSLLVVIAKELGIAAPFDCGPQGLLRVALVQVILKLELEPRPGGAVLLALVEHMPDMGGERYEADQMLTKQPLAFISAALCENATGGGQFYRTVLQFRKFQHMQRLGDRKQIIDLEPERTGDVKQRGVTSIGG